MRQLSALCVFFKPENPALVPVNHFSRRCEAAGEGGTLRGQVPGIRTDHGNGNSVFATDSDGKTEELCGISAASHRRTDVVPDMPGISSHKSVVRETDADDSDRKFSVICEIYKRTEESVLSGFFRGEETDPLQPCGIGIKFAETGTSVKFAVMRANIGDIIEDSIPVYLGGDHKIHGKASLNR